jgi:hypothetical protein
VLPSSCDASFGGGGVDGAREPGSVIVPSGIVNETP